MQAFQSYNIQNFFMPKIMNISLSFVDLYKITDMSFLRNGILCATQEYIIAVLADILFILHNTNFKHFVVIIVIRSNF